MSCAEVAQKRATTKAEHFAVSVRAAVRGQRQRSVCVHGPELLRMYAGGPRRRRSPWTRAADPGPCGSVGRSWYASRADVLQCLSPGDLRRSTASASTDQSCCVRRGPEPAQRLCPRTGAAAQNRADATAGQVAQSG